jgi:vacuolar-type H+-ATPase subunit B/Vma2
MISSLSTIYDIQPYIILEDTNSPSLIFAAKEESGRRSYSGYLYITIDHLRESQQSDGCNGSITQIPILSIPEPLPTQDDDITHLISEPGRLYQ